MAVSGVGTNILHITSSTDAVIGQFLLGSVRWVCTGAAAGDVCILTDSYGNLLFKSVANFPQFVDGWVLKRKNVNGLQFDTLTTGTVDVYLDPGG